MTRMTRSTFSSLQRRIPRLLLPTRWISALVIGMAAAGATNAADNLGLEPLAVQNYVIVPHNSYTPPRDVQVGTILQQKDEIATSLSIGTKPRTCRVYKTMRVNGTTVPGMSNTYRTNVDGIGVRFWTTQGWGGPWELGPVDTSYDVPPNSTSIFRASIELVVTGPVSPGVLTSLPSLDVTMDDCYNSNNQFHFAIATGAQIVAATCLVTTPSVAATLPPVRARDFSSTGATLGNTALRIGLNCTAGADVYVTLTDSTNPGNRTDRLTPASGSTAGGVAMRLLYNGAPVAYGPDSAAAGTINQWRVGTSATVSEVPLTAQYISTGTVTPGSVKGIATFTMSYQ